MKQRVFVGALGAVALGILGIVAFVAYRAYVEDDVTASAMIIGRWEHRLPREEQRNGLEFRRNGTVTSWVEIDGKINVRRIGRYRVEGNRLVLTRNDVDESAVLEFVTPDLLCLGKDGGWEECYQREE